MSVSRLHFHPKHAHSGQWAWHPITKVQFQNTLGLSVAARLTVLAPDFSRHVPQADRARLDDPCIDPAKLQFAADRRVDEFCGLAAEAPLERAAARVRLGGQLEYGFANRQPSARGNICLAQVEVDVKLIAGKRPSV